jgi:hypothetical protein
MQREQQISNCYVNLWLFRHWLDSRFFFVCDDAHITFLFFYFSLWNKKKKKRKPTSVCYCFAGWNMIISHFDSFSFISFPFPAGWYKDFGQNWDPSITGTPLCHLRYSARSEPISGLMMDRRLDKVLSFCFFLSFFWATGASKKERKKMCCKTQTYGSIQSSPRTYIHTTSLPPLSCVGGSAFFFPRPTPSKRSGNVSLCVC